MKTITTAAIGDNRISDSNFRHAPTESVTPVHAELEYASLTRVLEQAPIERKLAVFSLMAGCAADDAADYVEAQIAALRFVAGDVGLIHLVGTAIVDNTINALFWGASS